MGIVLFTGSNRRTYKIMSICVMCEYVYDVCLYLWHYIGWCYDVCSRAMFISVMHEYVYDVSLCLWYICMYVDAMTCVPGLY